MTKIKPVKAWAVVDPSGKMLLPALSGHLAAKRHHTYQFTFPINVKTVKERWAILYKQGYRCIPVTIIPEGE